MQDITPIIDKNKKQIEAYGGGGFKITGERYENKTLLVTPDSVDLIDKDNIEDIAEEDLINYLEEKNSEIEILLVGGGEGTDFLNGKISKKLKELKISVEYMATGPACRTYNILLSEERKVAALIVAV
jgi:uncharacterized protein